MAIIDRVTELVSPVLVALDLDIYDIEYAGGNLRITVDRDSGVTLDQLAEATRAVGVVLDEHDPMPGAYKLEVSSPGVERRLRTAVHFAAAVGERITMKLGPHVQGDRRVQGTLDACDDASVTVRSDDGAEHHVALADITRANTVFVWEAAPAPGSAEARARARAGFANKVAAQGDPMVEAQHNTDPERKAPAR